MMETFEIIGQLEELGFTFRLAIDYEFDGELTPEANELLHQLADDREAAIDCLLSRRFVSLDDIAIPAEWNLNAAMKNYVLESAGNILEAVEHGHSPLFGLLWCFKALCFIRGGESLYTRFVGVLHDAYGFDFALYDADWRRYVELQNVPSEDTPQVLPEYMDITGRLKQAGAILYAGHNRDINLDIGVNKKTYSE